MSRSHLVSRAALPLAASLLVTLSTVSVVAVAAGGAGRDDARADGVRLVVKPGGSAAATWSRGYRNGRSGFSLSLPSSLDGPLSVGLVLRAGKKGASGYRIAVDVQPDGRATETISRVTRGKSRLLGQGSLGTQWEPGDVLRVDATVRGSAKVALRMRAWVDGTTAPGWQTLGRDASPKRITGPGTVYAWAQLAPSAESLLTLALHPLAAMPTQEGSPVDTTFEPPPTSVPSSAPTTMPTESPTPTEVPTTSAPVTSDEFGPIGRAWDRDDLDSLGWAGIQAPADDSVTVVDPSIPLGENKPPGTILRAKLEAGETWTDGRCRAEVYGRRPSPWSTPAARWPDPIGSERWYTFSVFFPTGFPTSADTTWFDFTQWKGYRGGSPPMALEVKRNNLRFGGDRANHGLIPNDGKLGAITPGTWTRLTVGMHLSTSAEDGWVEVYRDGNQVVPHTEVATMDTYQGGADPIYLKQGIYRSALWQVKQAVYFSPMQVTETRPVQP